MQKSQNKPHPHPEKQSAKSKSAALDIIKSRSASHVELDYQCAWKDVDDLVELAASAGIRITHRITETIQVLSVEALQEALTLPKGTYRRRFLMCEFPLDNLPASQFEALEQRAIATGDFILPHDFFSSFARAVPTQLH